MTMQTFRLIVLVLLICLHYFVMSSNALSSSKTTSEKINQDEDVYLSRSKARVTYNNHHAMTEEFTTELLYRLDWVPCWNATTPAPGKQRHYRASIVYLVWSRRFECISNQLGIDRNLLDDFQNSLTLYYIESPNFVHKNGMYPSKGLSYYYIQCPYETSIYGLTFSLQEPITVSRDGLKIPFCVDYVNITSLSGISGRQYFACGHHHFPNGVKHLETFGSDVLVTFRSSEHINDRGFRLVAICVNVMEQAQLGCSKRRVTTTRERSWFDYIHQDYENQASNDKHTLYKLLRFHYRYSQLLFKGRRTSTMSSREALKHRSMLQLAVLSERNCEASIRATSKAVVDLFPKAAVFETKLELWKNI